MHLIDDERVEAAIVYATAARDAPGVYPPSDFSKHASADAMFDYVQGQETIPIHLWDVSFEARAVGARLERYKDRIEIAVHSDQEIRWKRFCTFKELSHILIDKVDDFSGYGNDRIDELLNKGLIGLASGTNPTKSPTQSELVAEICAIEIMYPTSQILKDIESHNDEVATLRKHIRRIALERRMPEFYTSTALDSDFRHYIHEAFRRCDERRNGSE